MLVAYVQLRKDNRNSSRYINVVQVLQVAHLQSARMQFSSARKLTALGDGVFYGEYSKKRLENKKKHVLFC